MATVTTARRHPDFPVEVKGEFLPRCQNAELTKNTPITTVDELGNLTHAGLAQESTRYTGTITQFSINNAAELLFRGLASTAGSSVSLMDYINLTHGVDVKNPKYAMGGAQVVGVTYSCQAPTGEFQAVFNLKGQTWTDGDNTITVAAPTGVGAYKSKDVNVTVGGAATLRVLGINVRADMPNQDLFELNNADPVATVFDSPNVTCDIDFYESDAITGATEIALATPADIVVTVGTTVKTITLKNMVWNQKVSRGTVRGWASRRLSYQSKGDSATGGLQVT